MTGNLTSVVFNGIDPVSDLPFGAAVGPDTGAEIHAIEVDEIAPDAVIPDLFFARWTDRQPAGFTESEMLGGDRGSGSAGPRRIPGPCRTRRCGTPDGHRV